MTVQAPANPLAEPLRELLRTLQHADDCCLAFSQWCDGRCERAIDEKVDTARRALAAADLEQACPTAKT
jgi:hypothetical protein